MWGVRVSLLEYFIFWEWHFTLFIQDVVRTCPGNEVFKDESIRNMMINILFIYCKEHLSLSYRQVSLKMKNYNSCLSSIDYKKYLVFHEFIDSCKEHKTKIITIKKIPIWHILVSSKHFCLVMINHLNILLLYIRHFILFYLSFVLGHARVAGVDSTGLER